MCVKQIIVGTTTSLVLCVSAYSQTVIDNVFSYSGGGLAPEAEVNDLLGLVDSDIEVLGDGWNTTVTSGLGVANSINASMPGDGRYTVQTIGLVSAFSTSSATRVFGGKTLSSSQTYELTVTLAQASMVGLLGGATIEIGYYDGSYHPVDLNKSGGGLLGVVDLLTLFGSGDTATIQFTPDTDFGGNDLYLKINTRHVASVVSTEVEFTGLSITQVPEPSVAGMGALGGAVLLLRRRRK